jgi:hypothetical protein
VLVMRLSFALGLLVSLSPAASAQDDPMEVQRCIWRCGDETGLVQPAYDACIAQKCDAGPSAQPAAPQVQGRWTYGDDDYLRMSAYIEVPEGAIGLACAYDGDSLAVADVVALRVTTGLAQGNELHYLFDGAPDGGTIALADDVGYLEYKGDTCSTHVAAFQKAKALFILEGKIISIAGDGADNVFTVEQAGDRIEVRSFDEAKARLKGRSIPLTGSSAAIRTLLANCPAAQRDIDMNCGM